MNPAPQTFAGLAPVAEWPMLRELDSETAQQVFHAAMEAFARPGTVRRLPQASLPAPVPAVIAPLLALADIMTPIAPLASSGDGDEGAAAAAIALAARLVNTQVVEPARARFGLAFGEPAELPALNRGSHWSPEAGAMLLQRVASLRSLRSDDGASRNDDGTWKLTGPGIKPGQPVLLTVGGLGERFVAERAERVSDYPAGIDILLVTDGGEIVGLPRTTRIELI